MLDGLTSRWISPGRVGGGQPGRDLLADPQYVGGVQWAGSVDQLLERLAPNKLHHQVRERVLPDLVDPHHVLVLDGCRPPCLAEEPLAGRGGDGERRGQHLDRDHPLEDVVERPEHDPEPAPAEHLHHLVVYDPSERAGPPPAALLAIPAAGVVDEDAAHGLGRGGEKVPAVVPAVRIGRPDQPEEGLVDQGGGLQRVAGAFVGHPGGGQSPELVVPEGQEVGRGLSVTATGGVDEAGNLGHVS
ncbi:MAG: hypothetical protein JWO38_6005 [Gemmataceae bacterium]|nr:hypothetical protein [Gemmataceae bacterium]